MLATVCRIFHALPALSIYILIVFRCSIFVVVIVVVVVDVVIVIVIVVVPARSLYLPFFLQPVATALHGRTDSSWPVAGAAPQSSSE